ncbi:MAG: cytochrome c [Gammaproteobacteria bacterium]|nr:cytochrome c [Gammaproteobacteria bacterium]
MRRLNIAMVSLLVLAIAPAAASERWFNQDIVEYGDKVFQQNCAVCHGSNAEGTRDWKKTDANGNYPPPPLNGSAHAWHHPIDQLARSIKQGGVKLGGVMPPFGNKLSDQEVLAAIAFFQSKWPNQVYDTWHQRFMQ